MNSTRDAVVAGLRSRWGSPAVHWPWLKPPVPVRILFYSDIFGAYDNGPFDGLQQVLATLSFGHYYWVRFEWGLASRIDDPSADADKRSKQLDQFDLSAYHQIWFFGIGGLPSGLTAGELSALSVFMDRHQGGILVTGDHYDLGASIASGIPRAGKMRLWPAPDASGDDRHSTLREGPSAGYQFEDQSDDVPQPLRLRRYGGRWRFLRKRTRPHPIMCGRDGPITTFPDHMHEGEVVVPSSFPTNEWPQHSGWQPRPEIVAWGTVEEPGLTSTGKEFGVVGAYNGHAADVGRTVADSTWHHWFDINLIGDGGMVGGMTGFNASPAGQAALRQIESYFLNVAIWLAPPKVQRLMRNRLMWGALWRDPLYMLSPKLPLPTLGDHGLDALGKYAPRCTIHQWVIDLLSPSKLRQALLEGSLADGVRVEECILVQPCRRCWHGSKASLHQLPTWGRIKWTSG